jgi:Glycerol dehydrogenase and related enzymes
MTASRTMSFGSPGRYIQGPGEIQRLAEHTAKYGANVFAIIDPFFFDTLTPSLTKQYEEKGASFTSIPFENEVTEQRIAAIAKKAAKANAEMIMGIGGGKTLDTAKGAANALKLPVVIVPTSASTDAPTSALSVIYKENHEHSHSINYIKSPDIVIIDSEIIANAPVRFLVSGMGDAMATLFEAKANADSNSPNYICQEAGSFRRTKTAMAIAQLCYDTIIEYGVAAKIANEQHVVTEALESVIEANTLMSGLGFENTACACAHAVGDGITATPNGTKTLHGEKVAFGTLCELVAENAPSEVVEEYISFCMEVGLPTTLADLQVDVTEENLQLIADNASLTELVREPYEITNEMLKNIVKTADAIGQYYKRL